MRQWHNMLRRVLAEGEKTEDRTGVGTLSVFGHQEVFDLREGFPLVTTKRVPFRWLAEELFWILRGSTDEAELRSLGVDIWKEWAGVDKTRRFHRSAGDLGPTYGFALRRFGAKYLPTATRDAIAPLTGDVTKEFTGDDQLRRLVMNLRLSPHSRRHIVTLWDPDAVERVEVPPCPCFFQVKVHPDGDMSLHLYQRSADLFLGVPFDIAEYALLLEMLCKVFGTKTRQLIVSYGDLHLYSNHINAARTALSRAYDVSPTLSIDLFQGTSNMDSLLKINWDNLHLDNYHPDAAIPADVAV